MVVVFVAGFANAEEIDQKFFKDWLTLSDLLRTKGVDPSSPNWAVINPMCLPLKTTADESGYNRCLYAKAMDEYQWRLDRRYCSDKSEQNFPDSLFDTQQLRRYIETDSTGKKRVIEENVRLYNNRDDLLRDRRGLYQDCMRDANWNDTENWVSGRR